MLIVIGCFSISYISNFLVKICYVILLNVYTVYAYNHKVSYPPHRT